MGLVKKQKGCDKCGRQFLLEYDQATGRGRQTWQAGCKTLDACLARILGPLSEFEAAAESDVLVADLELTARVYNCFRNRGITKLSQVVALTDAELSSWYNFGKKSLQEVRELKIAVLGESELGQSLQTTTRPEVAEVRDQTLVDYYWLIMGIEIEGYSVKRAVARVAEIWAVSIERVEAAVNHDCGLDGSENGEQ